MEQFISLLTPPAVLLGVGRTGAMETILNNVISIPIFYGLEIVAVVLLIGSAIYSRELIVIIILGVSAAVCMVVEWALCWVLANMKGADPDAETNLELVSAISILSLLIYLPARDHPLQSVPEASGDCASATGRPVILSF